MSDTDPNIANIWTIIQPRIMEKIDNVIHKEYGIGTIIDFEEFNDKRLLKLDKRLAHTDLLLLLAHGRQELINEGFICEEPVPSILFKPSPHMLIVRWPREIMGFHGL